jgi:peptide/nickel transport system permease protein
MRGDDHCGGPFAHRASRWRDSDLAYSFRLPVALVSAAVLAVCRAGAMFAPWVAPHTRSTCATLNLLDALSPPHGMEGARPGYLLGTDDQGATSCRRSCSARAFRCWSVSPR